MRKNKFLLTVKNVYSWFRIDDDAGINKNLLVIRIIFQDFVLHSIDVDFYRWTHVQVPDLDKVTVSGTPGAVTTFTILL